MSGRNVAGHDRAVLDAVDAVPVGRVTTYGRIAELVRVRTGRGSPRTVGQALARHGAGSDWFRVLHADGRLPPDGVAARAALAAEGIPVVDGRVRPLDRYLWPDAARRNPDHPNRDSPNRDSPNRDSPNRDSPAGSTRSRNSRRQPSAASLTAPAACRRLAS